MNNHLNFATIIVLIITSSFTACEKYEDSKVVNYNVDSVQTSLNDITTLVNTTTETTTLITTNITTTTTTVDTTTITTADTTTELITTTETQTDVYYTELSSTEYDMICAVVQAEANAGSIEFKEYIAGIIYNRIHSDSFPDTAYGVLTQKNQFGSISNYYYNTYPIDDDTRTAVSRIFSGYDTYILNNLNGAVSYCNPNLVDYSTLNWFETSLVFTYQCTEYIDGITWVHRFYALP